MKSPMPLRTALLAAAVLLCTSVLVRAQEPRALVAGMQEERTLGTGESHVYTITLQEGEAVVGEADQHGVDLVIDEYAPDGKLILTVDSRNGAEGPEPIEMTAFQTGAYRLVIHTLRADAKAGKYVMKIDRVLSVEENGQRLAEKNYPPALQALWRAYRTDPKAIEAFVAGRKGKGPIIEELKGDSQSVRVTYLYWGDANTAAVTTSGGPHQSAGGIQMKQFLRTPLFFATEIVPKDARYTYSFEATETRFLGPNGGIESSYQVPVAIDPLNPEAFGGHSALSMPAAPPQPWLVKNDSTPRGKLAPATLQSLVLKEDRPLTIYTPPGYEAGKNVDLLIVFDGQAYDGGATSLTPTPIILDNLIAAGKIPPTAAVFVNNVGHRTQDLADSSAFADFIGKELVPWMRSHYRIRPGASHVVTAGSSLGGLTSSYCAVRHPEAVGNALSLSGSYWLTQDWASRPAWPLTLAGKTGDLIDELKHSKRLPLAFYLGIGRFELGASMLGTNRELRDVLALKGYPVTYQEFDGEHDDIWWRGAMADGLIALLGQKSR